MTIVVADGSILIANEKTNSDLFWGVRGGGCNFGVVTEFVYKLHEQRRTVYAGPLIFPGSVIKLLAEVTNEWLRKGLSAKEGMLQILTRGPPPDCLVSIYHDILSHTCLRALHPAMCRLLRIL